MSENSCNKIQLFNVGLTGGFGGIFTSLSIYSALYFNNIPVNDALPLILFAIMLDALMIAGIEFIQFQHKTQPDIEGTQNKTCSREQYLTYYMGVKILSFIILGIMPILLGSIVSNDIIVYVFGALIFLSLGLVKLYLDKSPMSLLSNQGITIILVAVSYILGSTLLLALSNL